MRMCGGDGLQTCSFINQLKRALWQQWLCAFIQRVSHNCFLIFACLINLPEKVKCTRKDRKRKSALQYTMHVKGHSGKGIAQFCGA